MVKWFTGVRYFLLLDWIRPVSRAAALTINFVVFLFWRIFHSVNFAETEYSEESEYSDDIFGWNGCSFFHILGKSELYFFIHFDDNSTYSLPFFLPSNFPQTYFRLRGILVSTPATFFYIQYNLRQVSGQSDPVLNTLNVHIFRREWRIVFLKGSEYSK